MDRILPDWIEGYMELLEESEPPRVFVRWTAISFVAACLQRRCHLCWVLDEKLYPNMYIVLVGPSASRKGTAMGPAMRMLQELAVPIAPDASSRTALVKYMAACSTSFTDITGQAIPHTSMTVFSPELSVFFSITDDQLITNLTDMYDCRDPFVYHTEKQGRLELPNIWVNILGASTPSSLSKILMSEAIGAGLTSRMVFAYGDRKYKVVGFHPLSKEELLLRQRLLIDAQAILTLQGSFTFTEAFLERYLEWYTQSEKNPPFADPNLEPYLGRRSTHLRKLSMIVSASRGSSLCLTHHDLERALSYLKEAEAVMPKVFMGVGATEHAALFPRVMAAVAAKGCTSVGELMTTFYKDLTREELGVMLVTLSSMEPPFVKLEWKADTAGNKILYVIHTGRRQ